VNRLTDQQLLRDYHKGRSEAAFAELVRRHVDFVYSAALRMVCDAHLAEDVTQAVFVAVAQNARQLTDHPVLSGWLHRTTQNLAANTVRSEVRRHAREQQAAAMNELFATEPEAGWDHIAPQLDAALGELSEADRDALLLRYFERKSAREIAQILGVNYEAAQKRVSRAVERLREVFARRGVTVGASGLVIGISANAVQAAPIGLCAAITTAAALAGPTVGAATLTTATKTIAMTTLQKTLIAAALTAAVGTGIYQAHQASTLRTQVQVLEQAQALPAGQIEQLTRERDDATRQLASLREENERSNRNNAELLKLRAEVARLRNDSQELAQSKSGNSNDATESSAKSWVNRVNLLKQRLEQNPSAKIPELKYVTEKDWLNASKGELNTDGDYRRALSALRGAGESKIASMLKKALAGYVQASNGQFPTDLGQLHPYFDSPVDDAVLQRWEVAPTSTVKSLGLGGDIIITQKAPVDDVFDTRIGIGPNSIGSTDFLSREIAAKMDPVWEAYRASNNGQWPNDTSQLLPYATTSEQQAALQKLILRDSNSK
jgi:RNA polymerase sigma factor (sigma-70 family)